jgi:hypothetical protein
MRDVYNRYKRIIDICIETASVCDGRHKTLRDDDGCIQWIYPCNSSMLTQKQGLCAMVVLKLCDGRRGSGDGGGGGGGGGA